MGVCEKDDEGAEAAASTNGRPQVLTLQLDGAQTEMWVHRGPSSDRTPVLMLHGIQSHPGWFVGSADALAATGRTVYQFTRRGSGAAVAGRGDARGPAQLMADLDRAVVFALADAGAERLILLGVSWGGKYAAAYALAPQRARRLAGLILVAPGMAARVDVSPSTKLAVAACLLAAPRRRFLIPLSDPALFTDNPERQAYIRDDPHSLHRATARFLAASRRLDWSLARAAVGAITTPTALILASVDRIIDSAAVEAMVRRLAAAPPRIVTLPGCHTLEFEPDPAPLRRTLIEAAAEMDG